MYIDTHTHLNDPQFKDDFEAVLSRAKNAGVQSFIVSGYDQKSSHLAVSMAEKYPQIYATVGLHPSEVNPDTINIDWIGNLVSHPKVIGIGEIGLDYYWDDSQKQLQKEMFLKQIELAKKHQLPVVVHSRKAIEDTYNILEQTKHYGIMHCYSGSLEMAHLFIKLGFLLGIGGVVTFKNAHLRDVVQQIDLNCLVSETDAPYLAPHPYRGKRNEPQYLREIVNEIALIKQVSSEEVQKKLIQNTQLMFARLKL
ncbi:MAG: TatD family hydrolase [Bacilli bacterium]|jgi:TatD DNase family protein|nr:TatD family hydrolase [Bacilli bacterium]MDY0064035.1 TatD family hydrolase [Bacilli bacterium]